MPGWTDEVRGRLGFGFMRLPKNGDGIDFAQTCDMVDLFLESGFNWFDTAHTYLDRKSEELLRRCLVERHPRGSYLVAEKLSTENFEREEEIDPLLDRLLDALGCGHVDMLLMHAQTAEVYEKYMRCHAYEHAVEFVKAGKARHLGISFHDSPEVLGCILDEHPEVEAVQIQFNYADFENPSVQSRECYEVCTRRGIPAIVMEPVKGGNLVKLPDEAQAEVDRVLELDGAGSGDEAASKASSNAAVALRFAASFPNNTVILSGMSDIGQVRDNVATMREPAPLSDDQMTGLMRVHGIFKRLGMIGCTACRYCVAGCPKKIRIPEIMGCLNTQRVFGGWNPRWYYVHVLATDGHAKASECVRCGKCEEICPQSLPIRRLLDEAAREFE